MALSKIPVKDIISSLANRIPFLGSNNTFEGDNTFSGENTFNGDNDFNGDNTFSGDNDFNGDNSFSGALTKDGSDVYVPENILGTVSQSGGVPTGAIIERDSNANGEYVKYADGTLICWVRDTLVDHEGAFSSSTRLTGVFTFAASFVNASEIAMQLNIPVHAAGNFINCDRLNLVCWGTSIGSTVNSELSVFFTGGVSTSEARIENMQATAIGRWY